MVLDLKIAGGTIIDGSGADRYTADIGIRGDRIVEIGDIYTAANRTISAEGALVTPGFVDMHTHYDVQAMWDSELRASIRNGVTTAIMGNCGVGCAPFSPQIRQSVMALLEGVEEIPPAAMEIALDWRWRSFGSYLDQIAETPHSINLAVNATHAPIRMIAMGERSLDGSEPTNDDIARMQELLNEALNSGATAFSTDRIELHQLAGGLNAPDTRAPREEVLALAKTLSAFPGRPMQFASDYGMIGTETDTESELSLLREIAGLGITVYTPLQQYQVEGGWRRLASEMAQMNEKGAKIIFEASSRAIASMMGLELAIHPFARHPSYLAIAHLPLDQRVRRMRDPEFRSKLLSESPAHVDGDKTSVKRKLEQMRGDADHVFFSGAVPNYEPDPATSIKAIAEREGNTLDEVYYDALTEGDGSHLLYFPMANFEGGNLNEQHEILSQSNTIISFGDAGAHNVSICDAAYSSFSLVHWGRDRANGIKLERLVYQMTGFQSELFNLKDRGRIKVGAIADLNVIDHDRLAMEPPELLRDGPGGSSRLMQCATGYIVTLVGGVPVVEQDKFTGQLPGQVLRS